ncbi:MAG: hypothetical protein ACOC12_09525 [Bacteroidota bacterium]
MEKRSGVLFSPGSFQLLRKLEVSGGYDRGVGLEASEATFYLR